MGKLNKYFMLFIIVFLTYSGFGQYPLLDQSEQHDIVGVIGEVRGNGTRYHYGLDFSATDGTNVYAISTGPLRKLAGSIAVGEFGYIHITPSQAINSMPNGTTVMAGTLLGQIYTPDLGDHVHIQEANVNIFGSTATSWETGGIWINPIINLNPFEDNEPPNIDWIRLYRQGTNDNITSNFTLFGQVDLYLNGEDDGIESDRSPNDTYNLAPLSASFMIDDENGHTVYSSDGIDFSNVPPNLSATTIFHSDATSGNWIASLTNDPFNMPYNKFWNSRQKKQEMYNISTDIPEYNDYEGLKVKFIASSCDRFNCTSNTIPSDDNSFYTIDNFQPFLDAIGFVTNSTYRYYLNREQLDYSGLNDGYLVNLHSHNDVASMSLQPYTLVVNVSEPMQSLSVDYQIDGASTWISGGNMTIDPNNPLRYTWSGSPLADGCYKFRFAGQDKSGNDLMNVYDMTDENDTYDLASIPVRSSATQWTNQDNDHQTGYDYVNLCINASSCNFGNLIGKTYHSHNRSAVNCDDLSNLYTSVYYDCSKGEYQIQLQGVPQGFDVGWADGGNAYSYTGSMTYNVVNPGLYCYIIGSDNPCCYTEGCVTVTGDETPTFNFEYEFTNSSTSSTANLQITSPDPSSMALDVYIRLYDSNGNQVQSTTVQSANGIPSPFTDLIIGDEYCIRYEDANGCTEEYCFTVEGETCPSMVFFDNYFEITHETCENEQGSILVTAFDAALECESSGLSFLWSNGDTDGFADGLSAGTYCVTLTASGGSCDDCIAVRCFEIENVCDACDESIQVDVWTGDICNSIIEHTWKGQTYYELIITNGWIIVNASGGFGNLTITWDDGNYGWQRVIDTPGEYCATITDECGNTEMKCWTIGIITTDHYCLSPYFEQTHMRGSLDSIENNWNSYQKLIVVNDSITLNNTAYHSDSIHYDIHNSLVSAVVGKIQITKSSFMSSSQSELEQNTHQEAVLLHEEEKEIDSNPLTIRCLPNPFSHDLTVQLESANEEEGQLTVYSMNGEKYYSKKVWLKEGRNKYNIGDEVILLPSGIYIVNFTLRSGKTINERVIKI